MRTLTAAALERVQQPLQWSKPPIATVLQVPVDSKSSGALDQLPICRHRLLLQTSGEPPCSGTSAPSYCRPQEIFFSPPPFWMPEFFYFPVPHADETLSFAPPFESTFRETPRQTDTRLRWRRIRRWDRADRRLRHFVPPLPGSRQYRNWAIRRDVAGEHIAHADVGWRRDSGYWRYGISDGLPNGTGGVPVFLVGSRYIANSFSERWAQLDDWSFLYRSIGKIGAIGTSLQLAHMFDAKNALEMEFVRIMFLEGWKSSATHKLADVERLSVRFAITSDYAARLDARFEAFRVWSERQCGGEKEKKFTAHGKTN